MQIGTHAPTAAIPGALRGGQAAQASTRIEAVWAQHHHEVQAAQRLRLRWRVFAGEMGASLRPPLGTPAGLDADLFDAHCEHLIVRTLPSDDGPSQVVGTYRVLTPSAARRLGALYSDGEFDLVRLRHLRPHLAELGRSCTDPQWRQGGVILTLWSSLGEFLQRHGLQGVIGCASISMRDGGRQAAALWHHLRQTRLAAPDLQVRPRRPLSLPPVAAGDTAETPPLIKGYLRCGAQVLGPPAWDPDFGIADLPMMMRLADLPPAYRKRFITS